MLLVRILKGLGVRKQVPFQLAGGNLHLLCPVIFLVTFFWFHNVYKIGVSKIRQIVIKHNVALRGREKMSAVHFEMHPKNKTE